METMAYLAAKLNKSVIRVIPLIIVLLFLQLAVFQTPPESNRQIIFGSALTIMGLFLFLQGIKLSFLPLAETTGAELHKLKRRVIVPVFFVIGIIVTLTEPTLAAVAHEAETLSGGTLSARLILGLTALGFGGGMALGVTKVLFNIGFVRILVPALAILALLACFCDMHFAALAFNCAGAITGPANVPINVMLILGLTRSIRGVDPLAAGFGMVGLSLLGAAGAILAVGAFMGA